MSHLSVEQIRFFNAHHVAHLATVDSNKQPHVVPTCFALLDNHCYLSIDEKPKKVGPAELKRVRNIKINPSVALVIDRYSNDWSRLGYLLVQGRARVLENGREHALAVQLLKERYKPYQSMDLEARPIIAIDITNVVSWGNLSITND